MLGDNFCNTIICILFLLCKVAHVSVWVVRLKTCIEIRDSLIRKMPLKSVPKVTQQMIYHRKTEITNSISNFLEPITRSLNHPKNSSDTSPIV